MVAASEKVVEGSSPGGATDARRERWFGGGLIVVAAFLWSTSGFFAKAPIFDAWPLEIRGSLLAFWRAAFASLVLIFFVRKVSWSWKLIPTTLCFALMNWSYMNSLVYNEATLAIWLQYSSPIWVFAGSVVFFRERPIRQDFWLLGFAVAGVAVILWHELNGASGIGIRYGVVSGLFFAGVIMTIRWCRDLDAAWVVFLNHAVTCLFFAPVMIAAKEVPSSLQLLYLAGFGGLQIGIPYVLFAVAVRSVSSHEASGLTLLEPLLVPVWVWVAWGHLSDYAPPAITTLVGGGLILSGLAIRYWPRRLAH